MTAGSGARPFLTIVIPAYNEERRLAATLERVRHYVNERSLDAELLVVDDGSSDGTASVAESALKPVGRILRNPENRGKGYSVRRGILESRGRWILFSDADLSAPIEEHAKLAQAARDRDLDIVIGSRGLDDSRIEIAQNPLRQFMGQVFNRTIRLATGLPFRDTQCGFKLMDRERVLPIVKTMVVDRFAFDVELLFLATRFGLRVEEIPVVWRNSPGSKVSLFLDPVNMLKDVARVRWRFRRGLYNPESAA